MALLILQSRREQTKWRSCRGPQKSGQASWSLLPALDGASYDAGARVSDPSLARRFPFFSGAVPQASLSVRRPSAPHPWVPAALI